MVKQCWLCRKTKFLHPDLSFHSFPVDSHTRAMWLSKLRGKQQEESIPKRATICSTHFRVEDFSIKPSGIRCLKRDALPLFFGDGNFVFEPPRVQAAHKRLFPNESSTVTAPDSNFEMIVDAPGPSMKRSRKTLLSSDTSTETASFNSSGNIDSPGPSKKRREQSQIFHSDTSYTMTASETESGHMEGVSDQLSKHGEDIEIELSSGTESASETELVESLITEDIGDSSTEFMMAPKKLQKKEKEKSVNDLSSSDFSTPQRAEKNFRVLKKTVLCQKSKIKVLQQSVRRLKSKVTSLNSLIKLLKDKSLMIKSNHYL